MAQDPDLTDLKRSIARHPVAMVLTSTSLPDNPIVYVNEAFERITLYTADAAKGRNCRFLQGKDTDPAAVRKLSDGIREGRETAVDILNYRADGTAFMNRLLVAPLRGQDGEIAAHLGIQSEIEDPETGHVEDMLLRELQHRVKNHLSMVVSMIRMQSRREITRESFEALSHRIQSLALLYQELSPASAQSRTARTVAAGAYLGRIVNTVAALDTQGSIRANVECDEIHLPIETAARLGLLVTEFVTNAFEHAFEGRESGTLTVRFRRQSGGRMRLTIEDDGIGLPEGSTWPNSAPTVETQIARTETDAAPLSTRGTKEKSGLGGSIVMAMIETLPGTCDINSGPHGTVVVIDIDAP